MLAPAGVSPSLGCPRQGGSRGLESGGGSVCPETVWLQLWDRASGGAEVREGGRVPHPSPAHLFLELRARPLAGQLATDGCPEAQRGLGGQLSGRLAQVLQGSAWGPCAAPTSRDTALPAAGTGPPSPLLGWVFPLCCDVRLLPPPHLAPLTNFCPSLDLSQDRPHQGLPDTLSTLFPGTPCPVLCTPLSGPSGSMLSWSRLDPEPGGQHCHPARPPPCPVRSSGLIPGRPRK